MRKGVAWFGVTIFILGLVISGYPLTVSRAAGDDNRYITVLRTSLPIFGSYNAHFTAVTSDLDNKNPNIHFSWDRIHTPNPGLIPPGATFAWLLVPISYQIDINTRLSAMDEAACVKDSNSKDPSSGWVPFSKGISSNTASIVVAGKVSKDIPDARLLYKGSGYFRVVANPGTDNAVVVACRTEAIDSQIDDPNSTTVIIKTGEAHDGKTGKVVEATLTINGLTPLQHKQKYNLSSATYGSGTIKNTTPAEILLPKDPTSQIDYKFAFSAPGYVTINQPIRPFESRQLDVQFFTDREGTVSSTSLNGTNLGGTGNQQNKCNEYIGVGITGFRFDLGRYVLCQLLNGTVALGGLVTNAISNLVTTNPWDTVRNDGNGVRETWRVILGLVDLIVIGGLLAASFSNIFRFLPIKLDSYQIKQALPGIIWGVILANLSFFTLRLLIETASIGTQALADVVRGQIQNNACIALTGQTGSAYIMHEAWCQLGRSLVNVPPSWLGGAISDPDLAFAALAAAGDAILQLATVVIGTITLIIFMLAVIMFYAVLMFLLFIRNYVIVVLFILSPIAFFALGFPPLKSYWTKWWDTFWKWLLMLPATFSVIGFAIIVLSGRNAGALNSNEGSNIFDYFFFNGVAAALIYFAIRVPFMWGKIFGYDAMGKWAGAGSSATNQAHQGSKWLADKVIGGTARQLHYIGNKPKRYTTLHDATTAAKDYGIKGRAPLESDDSFIARVNKAARDKYGQGVEKAIGKARNKYNVLRLPESLKAGWKARQAGWKASEEYNIKQNVGYGFASGPAGQAKDLFDKAREEANAIDDYAGLAGNIGDAGDSKSTLGKLVENLKKSGMDDAGARAEAGRRLRALSNMQFGARSGAISLQRSAKNPSDRIFEGIDDKELQGMIEGARKWISIANRDTDLKHDAGASTGGEAFEKQLQGLGRAGGLSPMGTTSGSDEANSSGTGSGNSPGDADFWNKMTEAVRKGTTKTMTSTPLRIGAVEHGATVSAVKTSDDLTAAAGEMQIGQRSIDKMILRARKLGVQNGVPLVAPPSDYGINYEQFSQLSPLLESAAASSRALKEIGRMAVEEDPSYSEPRVVAKTLVSHNTNSDQLARLGKAIESANTVRNVSPEQTNRNELMSLHTELAAGMHALPPDKTASSEELHYKLIERADHAKRAVELYSDARTHGISIDDAAIRRKMEDIMLTKVGDVLDRASIDIANASTPITTDPKLKQELVNSLGIVIHSDPVINHPSQTAAISPEQVSSLAETMSQKVGEVVRQHVSQLPPDAQSNIEVRSVLIDPKNSDAMRTWLRESTEKLLAEALQAESAVANVAGLQPDQATPVGIQPPSDNSTEVAEVNQQAPAPLPTSPAITTDGGAQPTATLTTDQTSGSRNEGGE